MEIDSPFDDLSSGFPKKRYRNSLKRQAHTFASLEPDKENFNPRRHLHKRSSSGHQRHHSRSSSSSFGSIFKAHNSSSSSKSLQEAIGLFAQSTPELTLQTSTPESAIKKTRSRLANCSTPTETHFDFGSLESRLDDEILNQVSEDDDNDNETENGLAVVGSPLQQRQQARRRLEMNARIRKDIHRATSLVNYSPMKGIQLQMPPGMPGDLLVKSGMKTFLVDGCTLPHIEVEQFHGLLDQQKKGDKVCNVFDQMLVVDCRFEYEYRGGHIDGAINISSKSELEDTFFSSRVIELKPTDFTAHCHKLLVFHCEFSSHRGPLMANNLRNWDRMLNRDNYPSLYYPDVVILEGGYKKFYDQYVAPFQMEESYVEMQDPQFKAECEAGLDKLRRESKLSLSRHNSCCSSVDSTSTSLFSSASSSSSSLLKRWSSTSTVSLDFGSSRIDRSPCSPKFHGILGGLGGAKIDLDNLMDESPQHEREQPREVFKQPFPRRHHRSETIACLRKRDRH